MVSAAKRLHKRAAKWNCWFNLRPGKQNLSSLISKCNFSSPKLVRTDGRISTTDALSTTSASFQKRTLESERSEWRRIWTCLSKKPSDTCPKWSSRELFGRESVSYFFLDFIISLFFCRPSFWYHELRGEEASFGATE